MAKRFQAVGIGNAVVDVIARVEESFLSDNGVRRGIMQLIDKPRAVELYGLMESAREVSGGSAANTIAGVASLGGRTAYVGKVKDDNLGRAFQHDLRAQGVTFETPLAGSGHEHETGRCLVLVTPDGERSMNTYLGVSEFLSPGDIDESMMADADWIYLEGYRFDGPDSREAFEKAIRACKSSGGKVSLTLSDPFCVERHRDAFRLMIRESVDCLFSNEHELKSMYLTEDLDEAIRQARADLETVVCTRSEKGALAVSGGERVSVPAEPAEVVDATGAGDLFAGGFLWGLANGFGLEACARMGCIAGAEVISHTGARPETGLLELFRKRRLT